MILKSQMEHDVEVLLEYARANGLLLSKHKTNLIRFRPYFSMYDYIFGMSFGDEEVIESDNVIYLEMIFQCNLQWNKRI